MARWMLALLMLVCMLSMPAFSLGEEDDYSITEIVESVIITEDGQVIPDDDPALNSPVDQTARNDLIDRIIELGYQLYVKADGKAQRAHYAGDIYVCKNFTVYLFRQNRDDFRMAEFPDTTLVIPNNLPREDCKPYAYGLAWEDIPAS